MNQSNYLTLSQEKSEINLGWYLDIVIGNRWLIGMIVVGFTIFGALYAFMATPIYRADLMLQVEDNSPSGTETNLVPGVSSLFSAKSITAGEMEIIRSRLVVSRAVDNIRLYISTSPKYFPLVGGWLARNKTILSTPGIFGKGGYAWGNESIDVPVFDVPAAIEGKLFVLTALDSKHYRLTVPTLNTYLEGQVGSPEIFTTKKGKIFITVKMLRANPGTDFNLVRNSRLQIIATIQASLNILERGKPESGVIGATLEGSNPALISRILNEIGAEYVQQNIDRKSAEAAKALEFLSQLLPKMKIALEQAEQIYNNFRQSQGSIDVSNEGKLAQQQSVDTQTQLFILKQKRDDLIARFTESHPSVIALNEQLAALKRLDNNINSHIKNLPILEQEVVRRQRDVQVKNDLYISLLQSTQQLSVLKAGKIGNVRVVDAAVIPEIPVRPIRPLIIIISAFGGLLVGIATVFLKNMLFGGMTDPQEIESYTGLSVYATIPYSDAQRELTVRVKMKERDTSILALSYPHEPAIESLRSFRTALQFAMLDSANNIVMFTGPLPGVGKSFIAANFAIVLAAAEKRVLLIDADIRRGNLHRHFGLKRESGLTELLSGQIPIDEACKKTMIESLDLLTTGVLPPNPAELLLSPKLKEFIESVTRKYDFVILDTSPVLVATDAAVLAAFASIAFLIVFSGQTKAGEVIESTRRLEQSGVHVKGVIFNGMKPHTGRYGYGGKYGGYRYIAYQYGPSQD